jgi:hypothetical protein
VSSGFTIGIVGEAIEGDLVIFWWLEVHGLCGCGDWLGGGISLGGVRIAVTGESGLEV